MQKQIISEETEPHALHGMMKNRRAERREKGMKIEQAKRAIKLSRKMESRD